MWLFNFSLLTNIIDKWFVLFYNEFHLKCGHNDLIECVSKYMWYMGIIFTESGIFLWYVYDRSDNTSQAEENQSLLFNGKQEKLLILLFNDSVYIGVSLKTFFFDFKHLKKKTIFLFSSTLP